MDWKEFLGPYDEEGLFDPTFVARWGERAWNPVEADRQAAAKLHMQIISRIATQRLGYLDGVEKTALDSVYALFGLTRAICDKLPDARHFATLAWQVINTHVRPFTAKWHRQSQRGRLSALDTTDVFRAELATLQGKLRRFEELLAHLRDGEPPPAAAEERNGSAREASIREEMNRCMHWRIPAVQGGIAEASAASLNAEERKAVEARREHYGLPTDKPHAVALALSGGGIRSATFSLGVLVAFARRGLLPQFDYLSTVSGGGYLGSFLTAYLNTPAERAGGLGLRTDELPFRREGGEAEALRHIRHHSKYLASGSLADRLRMVGAQLYGMALNAAGVVLLAAVLALVEYHVRHAAWPKDLFARAVASIHPGALPPWPTPAGFFGVLFAAWAILALILIRCGRTCQRMADTGLVILGGILLTVDIAKGLNSCHTWVDSTIQGEWTWWSEKTFLAVLGAIPLICGAFASVAARIPERAKIMLALLSAFAAPLFFFGIYLIAYQSASASWSVPVVGILALVYFFVLNVNFTSPHRHYRNKLAEAYLIQPAETPRSGRPFKEAGELKLSQAGAKTPRAPYHLINAALNVPGSTNPAMQGRLTDFFLFSPAFCGSPLTGYQETPKWEAKDGHLDLGTAMAISGAAAAPQMGLGTRRRLSFWLALFNVRLGYWVRNPAKSAFTFGGVPGLGFLLKEMLGSMDERSPWLYVSDGGHIENLGVYELLRRRCKYIVAIDGEQDERMTFAALTTLQRLAAIDLGVKIDIDLDDLRLNEQGLTRSHFRFCRIEYPGRQYGYLLYVKLSLTGNEGEFLRRYRLDEPAFPHHSTANQFFTETQFEAYRSLGEHVGDKLFLQTLVGEELSSSNHVEVECWFRELGSRLLEPLV